MNINGNRFVLKLAALAVLLYFAVVDLGCNGNIAGKIATAGLLVAVWTLGYGAGRYDERKKPKT